MKILSIQNQNLQKMQNLQNTNNRPISFGELRSFVTGFQRRPEAIVYGLVMKFTEGEKSKLASVLEDFRNDQIPKDVLQIAVKDSQGETPVFCINRKVILNLRAVRMEVLDELRKIVQRITRDTRPQMAARMEKEQMKLLLSGETDCKFMDNEVSYETDQMSFVADNMREIFEKITGQTRSAKKQRAKMKRQQVEIPKSSNDNHPV